jgi:excisionase family DNA binding protein
MANLQSSRYELIGTDTLPGTAKIIRTLESREHALRAGEVAKLLGVTRQHIYKMAAHGTIPSFRVGTAVRFDPKLLAEWLGRKMPESVALMLRPRIAV